MSYIIFLFSRKEIFIFYNSFIFVFIYYTYVYFFFKKTIFQQINERILEIFKAK
jgi:hypothetical protein